MTRMCKDCGERYAQEMGLCRRCQKKRLEVDTPDRRRCVQVRLETPHVRCELAAGHAGAHMNGFEWWRP